MSPTIATPAPIAGHGDDPPLLPFSVTRTGAAAACEVADVSGATVDVVLVLAVDDVADVDVVSDNGDAGGSVAAVTGAGSLTTSPAEVVVVVGGMQVAL